MKGTYHAEVVGQNNIINSLQAAYSYSGLPLTNISCCIERWTNQHVFSVDQGSVFLQLPFDEPEWWLTNSTLSNLSIHHEQNPDPVNSKLEYLMDKIQEIDPHSFRELWFHLCNLAEKHLWILHQLFKIDPTLGARALMQCNDVYATYAGQAIMIWEC